MDNEFKIALDAVHAEEGLKRRTAAFLREKRRAVGPRRLAAALACAALILSGGAGLFFTPVSAVGLDADPSVELGINALGLVVSASGRNEAGAGVVSAVDVRYREYSQALGLLLESETMAPYLAEGAAVSITVVGAGERAEAMRRRITACAYAAGENVDCRCGSREEWQAAGEAGMPLGRYRVLLDIQALDPAVRAEDVKDLSMRQLRDLLESLGGEPSCPGRGQRGGETQGNGNAP